eukprot:g5891.t1
MLFQRVIARAGLTARNAVAVASPALVSARHAAVRGRSLPPAAAVVRCFSQASADARRDRIISRYEREKRLQLGLDVVTRREDFVFPKLRACVREEDGTGASKRLRRRGRLPCVLYGPARDAGSQHSRRVLGSVSAKSVEDADREYGMGLENTVFELEVFGSADEGAVAALEAADAAALLAPAGGDAGAGAGAGAGAERVSVHFVTARDVQRHPVTDQILAVNFLRFDPARPLLIPLRVVGEDACLPLKVGGWLNWWRDSVECVADDDWRVPHSLAVDVSDLMPKQHIGLDRITFPEGVRPAGAAAREPESFSVGNCQGKMSLMGDLDNGEGEPDGGEDEDDE